MPSEKEVALIIALVVMAILFLVVIIAFSLVWSKRRLLEAEQRKQRELIRAVVQTEETQKTKIAIELHNLIVPVLTLSALNLNSKLTELENGGTDFAAAKDDVEKIASIGESIREIAHGIIPKLFTTFGVIKSIENAVKQLGSIDQRKAIFENNTNYRRELPYSMVYQITIYNACLEILNNLRKHSNYRELTVIFEETEDFFTFVFAHDGMGVSNQEIKKLAEARKGIGLVSLESLAIALEGEIDYKKEIGISTVSLKFPVKNESSN